MRQKQYLSKDILNWCVYIIELSRGAYYTGITNNLKKRLKAHADGKGSAYVKSNLPINGVVYIEYVANRSDASKREFEIKKLRRELKIKLIKNYNDRSKT